MDTATAQPLLEQTRSLWSADWLQLTTNWQRELFAGSSSGPRAAVWQTDTVRTLWHCGGSGSGNRL